MKCPVGRPYDERHPTCKSCGDLCLESIRNKHGNKKCEVDGIGFDSKREAVRYQALRMMEKAGVITDLKLQVWFELAPAVKLDNRNKPPLRYRADFTYYENGKYVVEDAKSPHLRKNPSYRQKKHLMMSVFNIPIIET